jgi:hypothetical protein
VDVKHPQVGPIHINDRVGPGDFGEVGGDVVSTRGGKCEAARGKV